MPIIRLHEPLSHKGLWIAVLSEFIGTFFLVTLGVGIIFVNFDNAGANAIAHSTKFVLTGAGFGLAVGAIVFGLGFGFHHGSAHLNPAFTLGALVLDKLTVFRAVLFVVAQCLGGLAGGAFLYACFTNMRASHFACTTLSVDVLQGFGIEFFSTFTLVFGILALVAVAERHKYGALVVAGGVAVLIAIIVIIAGPFTGASLNPARSLGPAVFFGGKCWTNHWVYWAGPLTGGLLAGAIVRIMLHHEEESLPSHRQGVEVELHESRKLVTAPGTSNA